MPPVTDLISSQLGLQAEYRLFSAIAHAHPWALQVLSFQKANVPEKLMLEKNLSVESMQYIGAFIFRVSSAPILEKCKLFCWPYEGLEDKFSYTQTEFLRTINQVLEQ